MKHRARLLVVASIVLLLLIGGGLLARLWREVHRNPLKLAADLLPDVAQRIQNFHRVKVDGGRKVWEVSARDAQYFENEERVVVEEPMIAVYLEDGRTVSLRGQRGTVFLKRRELERVEVTGDIDVQLGDYALHADAAHYEAERDVIVAPGRVRISGGGFEILGEQLEIDVPALRFSLAQGVRMTLWPRS